MFAAFHVVLWCVGICGATLCSRVCVCVCVCVCACVPQVLLALWVVAHLQVLTAVLQQMLVFTSLLFVGHITGDSLELDGAGQ